MDVAICRYLCTTLVQKEVALTAVEIWGRNGLGARVAIFSSSLLSHEGKFVFVDYVVNENQWMVMTMRVTSEAFLYFPCSLMCLMKSSRGSTDWSANAILISFGSTLSDSTSISQSLKQQDYWRNAEPKKRTSLNKCHHLGVEKFVYESCFISDGGTYREGKKNMIRVYFFPLTLSLFSITLLKTSQSRHSLKNRLLYHRHLGGQTCIIFRSSHGTKIYRGKENWLFTSFLLPFFPSLSPIE